MKKHLAEKTPDNFHFDEIAEEKKFSQGQVKTTTQKIKGVEETDQEIEARVDKVVEDFLLNHPPSLRQILTEAIQKYRRLARTTDKKWHFVLNDGGKTIIAFTDAWLEFLQFRRADVVGHFMWEFTNRLTALFGDEAKSRFYERQSRCTSKVEETSPYPPMRFTMKVGRAYRQGESRGSFIFLEHPSLESKLLLGVLVQIENTREISKKEYQRLSAARELVIELPEDTGIIDVDRELDEIEIEVKQLSKGRERG